MKKLLTIMTAFGLLLMPLTIHAQADQRSTRTPPVSQPLVSEGDFAIDLVSVLNLGTPNDEVEAEDTLTSVGIAPRNGWIASYPLTPNIIGELKNAVTASADSRKLPMGKDDALRAFDGLATEYGLAVLPGAPGNYAGNQPQPNPADIDDYYSEEGPPVVTYYPPPPDYDYLYSWVPYAFWCSGFFFPGFFVLNDFNTIVVVNPHGHHHHHHHHHVITNHFIDPKTHTAFTVNPGSHAITKVSNGSRISQSSPQSFGGPVSCANCHGNDGSSKSSGNSHSYGSSSGGHGSSGFSGGSHGFGGSHR